MPTRNRGRSSGVKPFPDMHKALGSILSTLMPTQYCYFSEYRKSQAQPVQNKSPKPATSAPYHIVPTPSFLLLKPKPLEPFLRNLSSFVHSTHPTAHSLMFKIPTLNIRYAGQNPTSPVVCISVMRFIIQLPPFCPSALVSHMV